MGLHFGICHGPIDAIGEIRVGDRVAWQGAQEDNGTISIRAPSLFGGDEREGGVDGSADVLMGGASQTANSYLSSKIAGLMPSFRGIVSLVFKGGQISSNNPYVKPFAFKVTRINKGWDAEGGAPWYPARAAVWLTGLPFWRYYEVSAFRVSWTDPNWDSIDVDGNPRKSVFNSFAEALYYVINKVSGTADLSYTELSTPENMQAQLDYIFSPSSQVELADGVRWEDTVVRFAIRYEGDEDWQVDMDALTQSLYLAAVAGASASGALPEYSAGATMNPAHIIYQSLTNGEWGMGYPAAMIDDTSFTAAADTLYSEGFGLGMIWNRQSKIGEFIQTVLDHIGAVLYADPRTGKFVLKLIRADYTPESLDLFNESNIAALESYQRAGYGETVNEITVIYTDDTTDKEAAITVQDLANVQAQGAVVAQVRQYPGIRNATLAARVAERDLMAASVPLARLRIRVNRQAWSQVPGGVVKVSWAKLGIQELICRVLAVNYGTLTDGAITVELAEDVFGLPDSSFAQQQPGQWEEPSSAPAAAANRIVTEAGYYELQQRMTSTELAALAVDAGYLSTAAVRPSSDAIDYAIQTDSGSGYEEAARGDFCPSGTLQASIGHAATAITLENIIDGDLVQTGTYAQLGNEIVRIDAWNATTGAATIGRGVLDTVAAAHSAGARLYFIDGFVDSDNVERVDGETLDVKLLPKTGTGELAIADAPADTVTFDQRPARPYPPGQLRLNGEAYPTQLDVLTEFEITWAHRDRLQQNLEGDETGNIGPEASTTYSIEVENADTTLMIDSATGITGTSFIPDPIPAGTFNMTVRLWSVRGGLASRQMHDYTFLYNRDLSGDYWTAILGDGPLAYWRLEETSGTAVSEETGTFADGTINGTVTLNQAGLIDQGTSFDFDGTTGFVSCPSIGALSFPVSVEAWVHSDSLAGINGVFESHFDTVYRGVLLAINTNGSVEMMYGNGTGSFSGARRNFTTAAGVISAATTYHLVAVWLNSTTCKLYVNGASVPINYSSGSAVSLNTAAGVPRIGRYIGTFMNGRIDEVAIYNREVTATEAGVHYALGTTS